MSKSDYINASHRENAEDNERHATDRDRKAQRTMRHTAAWNLQRTHGTPCKVVDFTGCPARVPEEMHAWLLLGGSFAEYEAIFGDDDGKSVHALEQLHLSLGVTTPATAETIKLSAFSHFLPPTSPSSGSARSSVLQLESEYNTAAEATRLRVDAAAIAMEARDRIAQELVTARRAADLEHAQRKN